MQHHDLCATSTRSTSFLLPLSKHLCRELNVQSFSQGGNVFFERVNLLDKKPRKYVDKIRESHQKLRSAQYPIHFLNYYRNSYIKILLEYVSLFYR